MLNGIRRKAVLLPGLVLIGLLALACSSADPGSQATSSDDSASAAATFVEPERYGLQQALDYTMTLTTTSVGGTFGRLDRKHTCERGDASPYLRWEGVPDGAESLALIMEDLASDVHGLTVDVLWTHWVVYSIPTDVTELEPSQDAGEIIAGGAKQGSNDYERVQYNGPCPVPNIKFTHNTGQGRGANPPTPITAEDRPYYFRIYALDIPLDLESGATRDTLLETIDGHIVAAAELPVRYKSTQRRTCIGYDVDICLSLNPRN